MGLGRQYRYQEDGGLDEGRNERGVSSGRWMSWSSQFEWLVVETPPGVAGGDAYVVSSRLWFSFGSIYRILCSPNRSQGA
jgi:hypothetical protein